jgi:hypothetical protein
MAYTLLSIESDAKTVKGNQYGYLTGILYLAPSTECDGVTDLCRYSSPECRHACLYGAGMAGVFPTIKAARVAKTRKYLADPKGFMSSLEEDIRKLVREAKTRGLAPAVRLNGTSDVPKLARAMARKFPDVQFYDYTKIPRAWTRTMANYHLTFSHSEDNLSTCMEHLRRGVNVAVVFAGGLPKTWHGYPVVDGERFALRRSGRRYRWAESQRRCAETDGRRVRPDWESSLICGTC